MSFDPRCTRFPYPEYTSEHYLKIKKNNGIIFDKDYPYIDNSKSFRFKRFFVRFLLHLIVFPSTRFKVGLKIEGKKNLKKNKELIKNGVISISNHSHMWDYICIMKAVPKWPYTLVWAPNIRGENGTLARLVGGILEVLITFLILVDGYIFTQKVVCGNIISQLDHLKLVRLASHL